MRNIARVFAYLRGHRAPFFALLLLSLLLCACDILSTSTLSRVIDSAGTSETLLVMGHPHEAYLCHAALYIALLVGTAVFQNRYGYLVDRFNIDVMHRLRLDAYRWLLVKRNRSQLPFRDGDVIARLNNDVNAVTSVVASPLNGLVPMVVTGVMALAMLARLSPMFLCIAVVACPILYVATRRINGRTKAYAAAHKSLIATMTNDNIALLKNYEMYALYGDANHEFDLYSAHADRAAANRRANGRAMNRYFLLTGMTRTMGVALGIAIALLGIDGGDLSIGSIVLASTYLGNVFLPILQMSRYGNQIVDAGVALGRVFELQPDDSDVLREREFEPIARVALRDVRIAHDDRTIVDALSLTLRRGECVVLWGESGSGKTTLLRMLAGLQPAQAGTVHIDGRDATNALPSYRRSICLVPQTTALFNRSMRENIEYGSEGSAGEGDTMAETLDRAALSHLRPRLDDAVRDDMANLSGGERRRIAFARGLRRKASVYLFDEPTSELDAVAAGRVIASLAALKADAIVVVATHDAALRRIADHVVEM